jgi:hypothetical protein
MACEIMSDLRIRNTAILRNFKGVYIYIIFDNNTYKNNNSNDDNNNGLIMPVSGKE